MAANAPATPFAPPRVLAWELTRRCPLKCRHCRAAASAAPSAGELSEEECVRVIDTLGSVKMVIWTGGEPMLRADLARLVAHAAERGVRSVMAPCGMLVTEKSLSELKAAGVSACSFSLDAPDAARHDAFRGAAGAFDAAMRSMDAARAAGMPFQANVTVSKFNVALLDEIYNLALAKGAAKLDLFFLVPVGRGKDIADAALSEQETRAVLDWAFAKRTTGPMAVKETCCPSAPAYWRERGMSGGPAPCGCIGGRGFAFLSHTGILQTCGFVDIPCGDVRAAGLDFSAMVSRASNPLGECGSCRGRFA